MRVRTPSIPQIRRVHLALGILLCGAIILAGVVFSLEMRPRSSPEQYPPPRQFDVEATLGVIRSSHSDVFSGIRDSVVDIMHNDGIPTAIRLSQEAFQRGEIAMDQCHILTHYIGHVAYGNHEFDLEALLAYGVDVCGGGYLHGIEAQIVQEGAEGPEFRQELYRACELVAAIANRGGCYHGAGHGFMSMTLDVTKALGLCEPLAAGGGPETNPFDCYKGVFSEYTNLVGGVDGDTGLSIPGGPPLKLDMASLDFCASLAEQYQIPCALELNGLGFSSISTPAQVEQALRRCIQSGYRIELQAACVRSVSAVAAQHELPKRDTVTFQSLILSFPKQIRHAYIDGVGIEFVTFFANSVEKDWRVFCGSFVAREDQEFCAQRIGQ